MFPCISLLSASLSTTAGSYIFDFDQDGTDELLAVELNEDHTMNLVMYEVDDSLRVFRASSVLPVRRKETIFKIPEYHPAYSVSVIGQAFSQKS